MNQVGFIKNKAPATGLEAFCKGFDLFIPVMRMVQGFVNLNRIEEFQISNGFMNVFHGRRAKLQIVRHPFGNQTVSPAFDHFLGGFIERGGHHLKPRCS